MEARKAAGIQRICSRNLLFEKNNAIKNVHVKTLVAFPILIIDCKIHFINELRE